MHNFKSIKLTIILSNLIDSKRRVIDALDINDLVYSNNQLLLPEPINQACLLPRIISFQEKMHILLKLAIQTKRYTSDKPKSYGVFWGVDYFNYELFPQEAHELISAIVRKPRKYNGGFNIGVIELEETRGTYKLTDELRAEFKPLIQKFINELEAIDPEENDESLKLELSNSNINPYQLWKILEEMGYQQTEHTNNGWQLDFWIEFYKPDCKSLMIEGCGITFALKLTGKEED